MHYDNDDSSLSKISEFVTAFVESDNLTQLCLEYVMFCLKKIRHNSHIFIHFIIKL